MKINELTITEAHEELVSKKFTCTELIQSCLDSIKQHDGTIKAFVTVTAESALEEAKKVDEKIANGETIGILEGIPYSVKDIILTEGVKTTASSNFLKNFVAPYDATVIARLKNSGAILIGKTNCDAYGHGASNEYSDFFPTMNPWDTARVAGGSSGGSAASVSAGMCLFSLGGDTGGSIRLPAAFCGVYGLRPSYGRVSRYGGIAYASSIDTIGPLARSIEDIGIVLEHIAGLDENDHTTRPDEVPHYSEEMQKVKPLRIGLPKECFPDALDPVARLVIEEAIETLKQAGHTIVDISLPHATDHSLATYGILTRAETSSNLERLDGVRYGERNEEASTLQELYSNSRGAGFGAENKLRIMLGTYVLSAGYYDAYYKKAQKVRTLIKKDIEKVFETLDCIIAPASTTPAFLLGERAGDPVQMDLSDIFMDAFSLAGIPSLATPCGFADGLPVGMQIAGKYMDEQTVFNLAHQYQQLTGHHTKKPDLSNQ